MFFVVEGVISRKVKIEMDRARRILSGTMIGIDGTCSETNAEKFYSKFRDF